MKNLVSTIKMVSKFLFYGVLAQVIAYNFLFATDIVAQKNQSIKEIYVNVGFKHANLHETFKKIEAQTDLKFIYDENEIDNSFIYNRPLSRTSVENILLGRYPKKPIFGSGRSIRTSV